MEAWYNTQKQVGAPLLAVAKSDALDAVLGLKKEYDFGVVAVLDSGDGSVEALCSQAKDIFRKATGDNPTLTTRCTCALQMAK